MNQVELMNGELDEAMLEDVNGGLIIKPWPLPPIGTWPYPIPRPRPLPLPWPLPWPRLGK